MGYIETSRFPLDGNAAEEPGAGIVDLEKKCRPVLSILMMYIKLEMCQYDYRCPHPGAILTRKQAFCKK